MDVRGVIEIPKNTSGVFVRLWLVFFLQGMTVAQSVLHKKPSR